MKIAGFFHELWPSSFGEPTGSIHDSLASVPYEDASGIIEYLLAGHDIFSVMGSSDDVLGTGKNILGGDSLFSDGEWVWRGDLWFYVQVHNLKLPEEFLGRIRGNAYQIPPEDEPSLLAIAQYVHGRI